MFDFSSKFARQKLARLPFISVPSSSMEILGSSEAFREKLLSLIAKAEERIIITALYLQDDECGRELLSAIFERADAVPGLKARIYVDFHRAQRGLMGKGKQCGNQIMYRELKLAHPNADVEILGVPVKSKEMFGVLHLKGFVIDDALIYSGASINNVYLGFEGKYRLDRYHVISAKSVADAFADYASANLEYAHAVTDLTQSDIPAAKAIKTEICEFKRSLARSEIKFTPGELGSEDVAMTPIVGFGRCRNRLNKAIVSLIASAEKEITICTPYFNMPPVVARQVSKLVKRGIKVTFVVGDRVANDFYIPEDQPFNKVGALPYLYERNLREYCEKNQKLIDSGKIEIRLWKDGMNTYHVKGIFVDDLRYLLTGNNINPRAWGLDIENGIIISDPNRKLAEKFDSERRHLLEKTTVIKHFTDIEAFEEVPERFRNYLKKYYRYKLHIVVKKMV